MTHKNTDKEKAEAKSKEARYAIQELRQEQEIGAYEKDYFITMDEFLDMRKRAKMKKK